MVPPSAREHEHCTCCLVCLLGRARCGATPGGPAAGEPGTVWTPRCSHGPVPEEVVALVINDDERREVDNLDAPDGFHPQLLVLDDGHVLDRVLCEVGGGAADAAEVEAAVLFAGLRHGLGPVPLGEGHHGVAVLLEEGHVAVHAAGRRGPEAAARVALRRLRGPRVVDDVGAHVVGQRAVRLEPLRELRVRDVPGDDDGAGERQARLDGVLGQQLQQGFHRLVQVDLHHLAPEAGRRPRGLEEPLWVLLQFLDEDAVVRDLRQHLAVRAAGHPDADRAGGPVPRHPDDADVVHEVLAPELRPDPEAVAYLQDLLLPLRVAVSAAMIVSFLGEAIEVAGRGELDGLEAQLRGQAADDDRQVVGGARGGAQSDDLFREELLQGLGVQDRLRLLEEVRLVRRAPALGHEHELVLVPLHGVEVKLAGQVALGVLLGEHGHRGDLRVAEVPLGVGVVDPVGEVPLVLLVGPDELPLLAHADGGTCVLAAGQHPLGCDRRVLQEVVRRELVVVRRLGVIQDLRQLGEVPGPEVVLDVGDGALRELAEDPALHDEGLPGAAGWALHHVDLHALLQLGQSGPGRLDRDFLLEERLVLELVVGRRAAVLEVLLLGQLPADALLAGGCFVRFPRSGIHAEEV
mmetsp:Transcript_3863/g.10990  ORF Transcript_3863/g.10990 Transcript_3863/m.10990 type:complete len:633 (-) Transcript_3863:269-2167(-)